MQTRALRYSQPRSFSAAPGLRQLPQRTVISCRSTVTALISVTASGLVFLEKATTEDFNRAVERLAQCSGGEMPSSAPETAKPSTSRFSLFGLFGSGEGKNSNVKDTALGRPVVLALFTATWCGPCTLLYKELRHCVSLLPSNAPVTVLVLDVEENHELASLLQVSSLPTMLFLGPNGDAKPPLTAQGIVSGAWIRDILFNKAPTYAGTNIKSREDWVRL